MFFVIFSHTASSTYRENNRAKENGRMGNIPPELLSDEQCVSYNDPPPPPFPRSATAVDFIYSTVIIHHSSSHKQTSPLSSNDQQPECTPQTQGPCQTAPNVSSHPRGYASSSRIPQHGSSSRLGHLIDAAHHLALSAGIRAASPEQLRRRAGMSVPWQEIISPL